MKAFAHEPLNHVVSAFFRRTLFSWIELSSESSSWRSRVLQLHHSELEMTFPSYPSTAIMCHKSSFGVDKHKST